MPDYLPYIQGVAPFSDVTASAAVTGGQLVEVTGVKTVGPAGAASVKVVGVAAHDAGVGASLTVHPIPGNVHETTTPGGVTAGQVVIAAAAGTVNPVAAETGLALQGVALNTAAAAGKVRWAGR